MTGLQVPIYRHGTTQRLDLDTLTDAELETVALCPPPGDGWDYALALARWIRDTVPPLPSPTPALLPQTPLPLPPAIPPHTR